MEPIHHEIDNQVYDNLGERWYSAWDDPVAILRAELGVKIPWMLEQIRLLGAPGHTVLDVGCGGGLMSNDLARRNFKVTGIDISLESLKVARAHDGTHSVNYLEGDVYNMPFSDDSFDLVLTMDFLENIKDPKAAITECARVLKKGGLFFFYTFNRNMVSNFVAIRLVEKYIKNTPKNMHMIHMFITPEEIQKYCQDSGLKVETMTGVRPVASSVALKTALTGVITPEMRFKLTSSKMISYMGVARKL